jgi:hypothetical protein
MRVFLNADPQKPMPGIDSPHFVSSFSFYGSGHAKGVVDQMLSLNATVARLYEAGLLAADKPLIVTAVATPLDPRDDISGVRIPFKHIRLTAIRVP